MLARVRGGVNISSGIQRERTKLALIDEQGRGVALGMLDDSSVQVRSEVLSIEFSSRLSWITDDRSQSAQLLGAFEEAAIARRIAGNIARSPVS